MGNSTTVNRKAELKELDAERMARRRLEKLLAENAAFLESRNSQSSRNQNLRASTVKNPVSTESAVAGLGLLTGLLPTSAILIKIFADAAFEAPAVLAFGVLGMFAIAATSAAGYFSGKLVGRILSGLETSHWALMLLALPFVGIVWGLLSGAVGGVVLFGIGAIFGAAIGAAVAPFVITTFGICHRLLKTGDVIERNRFLPVAVGITLTVAAFILGY